MRWKGTVNNYQGIISYWVTEQLQLQLRQVWLGSTNKQTSKQSQQLPGVPEVLFISILTSCRWASLSHRARQAETWKEPTKKLSKGFKFHTKKLLLLGSTCWSVSEQIHCLSRTFVSREGSPWYNVTVTHSGSRYYNSQLSHIFSWKYFWF